MMNILYAVLVLGVMGAIFGGLLAFAAKIFHVEQDPRIDEVRSALAGANCGGCGYAGCDAYAAAVVAGEAPPNKCSPGGAATAAKVAAIMGIDAAPEVKYVAFVPCSGSAETAELLLKKGMYLGFGGSLTFKNNVKTVRAAEVTPIDRILLETDSPYLAPVPMRGKRNEPAYTAYVAQRLGEIKGLAAEEVAQEALENTRQLFRI